MANSATTTVDRVPAHGRVTYWSESKRPIAMLVFLSPLIVAYEIGAWRYLSGNDQTAAWTVSAQRMLSSVFEAFGVAGLHIPSIMLVVVLLVWHMLQRAKWRVSPSVVLGMFVESAGWAIPLIFVAALMAPNFTVAAAQIDGDPSLLGWQARATISIGAGLYEELLFRMIAIAAIHFVVVDLLRLSERTGLVVAITLSAALFAVYHTIPSISVGIFYALAGVYFGVLYVARGFGIVVGCHAAYDLVALVLGPATS